MKKQHFYILAIACFFFLLSGCDKDLLEKQDPSNISSETFYKTEADAIRAVNAAYASLGSHGMYGRLIHMSQELISDETQPTPSANAGWIQMKDFVATADNELPYNLWISCYQGIFRANIVIEKVPSIDMNEDVRDRIVGEAKFLRAYYYWLLAVNFGDVPLITTPVTTTAASEEAKFPARSPVTEVYRLMEEDLQDAIVKLEGWDTYDDADKGRITRGAAMAMLGKVYLYQQKWAQARDEFAKVIASGVYSLTAHYRDNHTGDQENNEESVFEAQFFAGGGAPAWGNYEDGEGQLRTIEFGVRGRAFNNVIPSQWLISQFETGDPRLLFSVFGPPGSVFDGKPYPEVLEKTQATLTPLDFAIRKYQKDAGNEYEFNTASGINLRLIRYADVLLMYAEALNESGDPAAAYGPINQVRARVGLAPITIADLPASADVIPGLSGTSEQERMRARIVHERTVELSLEGHRWRDLVRWRLAGPVLRAKGKNFRDDKHYLFPIPQTERDANPNLTQNPNW